MIDRPEEHHAAPGRTCRNEERDNNTMGRRTDMPACKTFVSRAVQKFRHTSFRSRHKVVHHDTHWHRKDLSSPSSLSFKRSSRKSRCGGFQREVGLLLQHEPERRENGDFGTCYADLQEPRIRRVIKYRLQNGISDATVGLQTMHLKSGSLVQEQPPPPCDLQIV